MRRAVGLAVRLVLALALQAALLAAPRRGMQPAHGQGQIWQRGVGRVPAALPAAPRWGV